MKHNVSKVDNMKVDIMAKLRLRVIHIGNHQSCSTLKHKYVHNNETKLEKLDIPKRVLLL